MTAHVKGITVYIYIPTVHLWIPSTPQGGVCETMGRESRQWSRVYDLPTDDYTRKFWGRRLVGWQMACIVYYTLNTGNLMRVLRVRVVRVVHSVMSHRTCLDAVIDDRCLSVKGNTIYYIREHLFGRCESRVNYIVITNSFIYAIHLCEDLVRVV